MFVRLLALLLTLGMVFISTETREYTPLEAPAAVVDVADDAYDLVTPAAVLPAPERRTVKADACVSQLVDLGCETFVFRPPRAALA